MWVPDEYLEYFDVTHREEFDIKVPFIRESWHGRMLACRGVGASLSADKISLWEKEHKEMLNKNAPVEFEVLHYVAIAELTVKK